MAKKKKFTIYSDEMDPSEQDGMEDIPLTEIRWRIRIEKKGRGGKVVTILDDALQATEEQLTILAKELKKHCGVGGSVKEEGIVLQGDVRQKTTTYMKSLGCKDVK